MFTKRKIQLGAAAVIANGLLALTIMTPPKAIAASCGDKIICTPTCGGIPQCQAAAAPGCTTVSSTCGYGAPWCVGYGYNWCKYQ